VIGSSVSIEARLVARHEVRAELHVVVGAVHAGIVHHHADAAAAEGRDAAVVARIVDGARGAGDLPRFLVEVAQRGVPVDRGHVAARRERLDLRAGGAHAGDRQAAHDHALVDAEGLQHRDLRRRHRAGLAVAHHDFEFVGGARGGEPGQQLRIEMSVGEGDAAGQQADRQGGNAEETATFGRC